MHQARAWTLLPVVLLLAGCAESPPEPAPTPDVGLPAELLTQTIDAAVEVEADTACINLCFVGGSPIRFYKAPADAQVLNLSIEVAPPANFQDEVRWALTCRSDAQPDDLACSRELASGQQTMPFAVDLRDMRLPVRAELFLRLVPPATVAPVDFLLDFPVREATVTGSVDLQRVPDAPVPDHFIVALDFTGHSGPCAVDEPYCTSYPGGADFPVNEPNLVVGINVTMTWTATGPLDQELDLTVYPNCDAGVCPEPIPVQGPSPLVLTGAGFEWTTGFRMSVLHTEPTGMVGNPVGTRTPVHVTGTYTVEVWPEPEDDDETA